MYIHILRSLNYPFISKATNTKEVIGKAHYDIENYSEC